MTSADKTPANPTPPHSHEPHPDLRKWFGKGLRYVVPLAVSAGLVVWLFHKTNFHSVMGVIRNECDYRWIILMMVITALSHTIRGARWGIQLRGAGIPRIPLVAEAVSIYSAYALNLLFPNIGELWRITYISRREKAKFSTVLGTDIGDRLSDLAVIVVLIALSLVVAHPAIMKFMTRYAVGRDIERFTENPWLWCCIAFVVAGVWSVFHFCRHYRAITLAEDSLLRVWDGFRIIFTMKGRGLYLLLTLGIWTCYFLETYVCFMAFPFTRSLIHDPALAYGLIPGLVAFVFGSCSMAIPSNGGLGPWNLAVMFALGLYGISTPDATAFTITMWSFQAAMLILLGIFSAVYISVTSRHLRAAPAPASDPTKPQS